MTRETMERYGARFRTVKPVSTKKERLSKRALSQRRYRQSDPEHYREQNAKHQKAWRERETETSPMKPKRIQLSRKKGWKMPPNTVKVDRTTSWGNPYVVQFDPHPHYSPQTVREAVEMFRRDCKNIFVREVVVRHLRGKNLACWCKIGEPCHADVLLEIANQ